MIGGPGFAEHVFAEDARRGARIGCLLFILVMIGSGLVWGCTISAVLHARQGPDHHQHQKSPLSRSPRASQ